MPEVEIEQLRKAVERMHGCSAVWIETAPINETFQDKPVWQGEVQVFDLIGHPSAKRCYAWSFPIEESTKRRFFAVLHQPPVTSPIDAVRAAIVQEHRSGR